MTRSTTNIISQGYKVVCWWVGCDVRLSTLERFTEKALLGDLTGRIRCHLQSAGSFGWLLLVDRHLLNLEASPLGRSIGAFHCQFEIRWNCNLLSCVYFCLHKGPAKRRLRQHHQKRKPQLRHQALQIKLLEQEGRKLLPGGLADSASIILCGVAVPYI